MQAVKWGEYTLNDLFTSQNGDFDIKKTHINNKGTYVITAGLTNNGVLGKSDVKAKMFNKNTITVDMFGNAFYRQFDYKMVTHARVFSLKTKFSITKRQGLFLSNSICHLSNKFGFDNMCSWEKIKSKTIKLPCKDGKIDFDFMESFVAELEVQRITKLKAYLSVTGLTNYTLTDDEKQALNDFSNSKFADFTFRRIFSNIKQGRRLKKDDQIPGTIPFVMAGTTNTGVANFVSNPVASFPKNSITMDIFGNTFYRNYEFGAGDDTGVYWNVANEYPKEAMLYIAASMAKSVAGKFSYGEKLRSSQSLNFRMKLPCKNNEPDFEKMTLLISAIQKLVIKDVVLYADKTIEATRKIIVNNN